jgi:hypothetical protein
MSLVLQSIRHSKPFRLGVVVWLCACLLVQNALAGGTLPRHETPPLPAQAGLPDVQGIAYGFFDNPISSAKGTVASIWGIGKTAIKTAALLSPLGVVWEFTFGDRYATEIKTATKFANRLVDTTKSGYDFVTKYGPTVLDFLWKLTGDIPEGTVKLALSGEIPGKDQLGPELRTAVEVSAMLLVMAVDAWTGLDSYHRGYWVGYLTFEVVAAVIAAAATAPAGGEGAIAYLARHVPKLETLMEMVKPMLTALQEVPQLAKLLEKVTEFGGKMSKIGPFCFVKGTPVLTVKGLKPIEQIKPWDWVWSRSEDGLHWSWRPVRGIVTTHPDTLVHVRYAALSRHGGGDGSGDDGPSASVSSDEEAGAVELVCTPEHPFHVERAGYSGFLPLREVTSGDLLTLADGSFACVQDLLVERAPVGSLFTTYNFEVAEHHTYFAGELPVWVHNTGLSPCDKLTKHVVTLIAREGDEPAKFFGYLVRARNELDPRTATIIQKIIPDKMWSRAGRDVSHEMMQALKTGEKGMTWDKIPNVADWDSQFFKRPKGFDYKKESWANAKDMVARTDSDLHHIIPKHIMKRLQELQIKVGLDLDATPGHLMPTAAHQELTKAMNKVLSPSKVSAMGKDDPLEIARALAAFYESNGESGQSKVVRGFFGIP